MNIVSGQGSFALCCLYNPPGVLSNCINVLCNITDFISANDENICFVGDLNLSILMESTVYIPSVLSDFIDYILLHSLTQVVTSSQEETMN